MLPFIEGVQLGHGIDKEDLTMKACPFEPPEEEYSMINYNQGTKGELTTKVFESNSQLADTISANVEAGGGGYGVTAKASIGASNQKSIGKNEIMGVFKNKMTLGSKMIKSSELKLATSSLTLLKDKGGEEKFMSNYGTHFVVGYVKGCLLEANTIYSASTTLDKKALSTSISASYATVASASVSVSATKSKSESETNAKTTIYYNGRKLEAFTGLDIAQIKEEVMNLPVNCDGQIQH